MLTLTTLNIRGARDKTHYLNNIINKQNMTSYFYRKPTLELQRKQIHRMYTSAPKTHCTVTVSIAEEPVYFVHQTQH